MVSHVDVLREKKLQFIFESTLPKKHGILNMRIGLQIAFNYLQLRKEKIDWNSNNGRNDMIGGTLSMKKTINFIGI